MATITLKLDTRRKNKNGEYPIVYSISHQSVSCTIPSGICIKESELYGDSKRMVRSIVANADEINAQLYDLLRKYQDKLASLTQKNKVAKMTASEIKHYLLTADDEVNDKTSFTDYAKRHIAKYSGNTRRNYEYTLRLLEEHFNGNVIFFNDITVGVLRDLEAEWGKTRGVSARSIHFRNIRTIFNRAIDDEVTNNYPFRKFKIKASHKDKDYMPVECMKKLMELEFPETEYLNRITKDMFLLSFYLCGVNFNDIFSWGKEVLQKNKIVFVRKKIAFHEPDEIKITLQPEAKAILQKYKGEKFLLNLAEKYNNNYDNLYGYMKHRIGKIGEKVGFPKLTMYYARYSWATYADQLGIDEKVISKSLGHTDQSVAGRHYISYDWSRTDEANRKVIDYVLAQ